MDFWTLWMDGEEVKGFIKCCPQSISVRLFFLSQRQDYLETKVFNSFRLNSNNRVLLLSQPDQQQGWRKGVGNWSNIIKQQGLEDLISELEIKRFSKLYTHNRFPDIERWAIIITGRRCECCNKPMLLGGSDVFGEDTICEDCLYGE